MTPRKQCEALQGIANLGHGKSARGCSLLCTEKSIPLSRPMIGWSCLFLESLEDEEFVKVDPYVFI